MRMFLGNNPDGFSRFGRIHVSKTVVLTFLEHWLLRGLFLVAVLIVAGSLLWTVQHLQSIIDDNGQQQTRPKTVEAEQQFIETHKKKISLPNLSEDQLQSPF